MYSEQLSHNKSYLVHNILSHVNTLGRLQWSPGAPECLLLITREKQTLLKPYGPVNKAQYSTKTSSRVCGSKWMILSRNSIYFTVNKIISCLSKSIYRKEQDCDALVRNLYEINSFSSCY